MSRPGTFLGAVALLCLACGDAADDTTNATGGPSTSQPSATGDTTDVAPTSTASETAVPTTTSSETTTAETTDPTSTTGPGELTPRAIIGGTFCTCVLWNDDTFRCWGKGEGLACTGWGEALLEDIGDDEVPASVGDVPAPYATADLDIGSHSCAVTVDGEVRCWGVNDEGQLGMGTLNQPAESAAKAEAAFVGPNAASVAVGEGHTCAVFTDGALRCWGQNSHGELGYGHTDNIGDDEVPLLSGDVSIGGKAVQVVAGGANLGGAHTCVLLEGGAVRCFGWTAAGAAGSGVLGYGNLDDIGDDEVPSPAGIVPLAQPAIDVAATFEGTCALLEGGAVQCWGLGELGTHGAGHVMNLGDDETPMDFGPVDIGGAPAIQIAAGRYHVCALLADSALRCWGFNATGQLGYGNTDNIGDDETPASAGDVPFR